MAGQASWLGLSSGSSPNPAPGTLSFSCSKSGLSQGSSTVNCTILQSTTCFPGGASGKEPTSQCRRHRRHGFRPWVARSPGGGHGNPCQYSCLENLMNPWRIPRVDLMPSSKIRQPRGAKLPPEVKLAFEIFLLSSPSAGFPLFLGGHDEGCVCPGGGAEEQAWREAAQACSLDSGVRPGPQSWLCCQLFDRVKLLTLSVSQCFPPSPLGLIQRAV